MLRYCYQRRRYPIFCRLDENFRSSFEYILGCKGRSLVSSSIRNPTADEVMKDVDLSNKTCLITGANSGLGLEMTRCLNSRDCKVLMACRNPYAAKIVAKNTCTNTQNLKVYELNLCSLQSVQKCSDEILEDQQKLDIVILNAGVFGLPWILTKDKLETTFQVNYLSQYMLLMKLEPILAPDARLVIVSAESHRNVRWDSSIELVPTEEMVSLPQHEYTSIKAYNISKLCGVLFMHYLSYRWMNTNKAVFCAHPGSFIKTRLCRNWGPYEALYTIMKPFSKSIEEGASTPLYCATSPELEGQTDAYYKDCRRHEESDLAKDLQLSFRIQHLTQDMIRDRVHETDQQLENIEKTYSRITKDTTNDNSFVTNYSA